MGHKALQRTARLSFPCRSWPAGDSSPAVMTGDRQESPAGWLLQGEQAIHRQRAFVFVGAGLPAILGLR